MKPCILEKNPDYLILHFGTNELNSELPPERIAKINYLAPTFRLLKKRLWRRCFPVSFVKFLRTPFLTEHLQWLLLSSNINEVIRAISNLFVVFY